MLLDDDLTRIRHILDAAQEAMGYAQGIDWDAFRSNRPLQHSVVRCIEIVGEASSRVSKGLRDSHPGVPWADVIGMRNRIVHSYYDIDLGIVWKTVIEDLPVLLPELETIQKELMRGDRGPTSDGLDVGQ